MEAMFRAHTHYKCLVLLFNTWMIYLIKHTNTCHYIWEILSCTTTLSRLGQCTPLVAKHCTGRHPTHAHSVLALSPCISQKSKKPASSLPTHYIEHSCSIMFYFANSLHSQNHTHMYIIYNMYKSFAFKLLRLCSSKPCPLGAPACSHSGLDLSRNTSLGGVH